MKLCIPFLLIAALGSCASSSGSRTVYLLGRFSGPAQQAGAGALADFSRAHGRQLDDAWCRSRRSRE